VVNDRGSILPGSCRFTKQQTEEWAVQHCAWEQMRQLGARVMQARLTIEEDMDVTLMSTPQKKRYIVHTMTG
jgi:hypothetical protein